jgi:carboxyl-terminal processing protease
MRRVTRLLVVFACLWLLAGSVAAGQRARFIPAPSGTAVSKAQKRGRLTVKREGKRIKVRAYIPATRNGVAGLEVIEIEREAAGPEPAKGVVSDASRSFSQAIEIAVDETWRRDLGAGDMYKGVLREVRSKRTLDEVEVFESALKGLAKSLRADTGPKRDRWTQYFTPEEYAEWEKDLDGSNLGLGVQTRAVNKGRGLVITRVTPGSAAAKAGLRKGDQPLSVDGKRLGSRTWVDLLKSKGDQPFVLAYRRGGERRSVTVTRAPLRWPLRAQRTREGMAVVRFNDGFTSGVAEEIRDALIKLEERGPLRGIVIDLRDNGGGLVREAQALLDDLVASGNLGVYLYGDGSKQSFVASGKARFGDVPLAVLINEGSASMSEHVPNVLKSLASSRGVVILGERTYGKGLMQTTYDLPRGGFKISNATFNNGKLENTQGNGVEPDVSKEVAIERQKQANPGKVVVDPVLRQAIAELERANKVDTSNLVPFKRRRADVPMAIPKRKAASGQR